MTDATRLLHGLEDYAAALDRHLARLRDDGEALQRIWLMTRELYRGQGAEVFAEAFERANRMLEAYRLAGESITPVLRSQIDHLRQFDSPDRPGL